MWCGNVSINSGLQAYFFTQSVIRLFHPQSCNMFRERTLLCVWVISWCVLKQVACHNGNEGQMRIVTLLHKQRFIPFLCGWCNCRKTNVILLYTWAIQLQRYWSQILFLYLWLNLLYGPWTIYGDLRHLKEVLLCFHDINWIWCKWWI